MRYLFFFLLIGGSAIASPQSQVIEQLNHLINATKNAPASSCEVSQGDVCSFAQMCDQFRANRNSKYLYKNADGKVILNHDFRALYAQARYCQAILQKKLPNFDKSADDADSDDDTVGTSINENKRKYLRLRQDFLKTVDKNGDQKKYTVVETAMLDIRLNEDNDTPFADGEQARKFMAAAERSAKVHLTDATRNKWLALLHARAVRDVPMDADSYQDDLELELFADDPLANPRLLASADSAGSAQKLQKYRQIFKQADTHVGQLFEDARKDVIEVLQGKKTAANRASIDEMIKRIATVKYQSADDFSTAGLAHCKVSPAHYDQDTHSFQICPQIFGSPDATLFTIMAHEMSHSIDPCTITFALAKDESGYAAVDTAATPKDKIYAQAFEFSQYPLKSVVTCLAKESSVGARLADTDKMRRGLEAQIELAKLKGATDDSKDVEDLRTTLSHLDTSLAELKACSDLPGKSEMGEAFADWASSKALARKIKSLPVDKQRTYFIESQGEFMANDCIGIKPDSEKILKKILAASACNQDLLVDDKENLAKAVELNDHPDASLRLNKIYLAQPEILSAAQCKNPDKVEDCE